MSYSTEEKFEDVKSKATRGMGWNFLSVGGSKILTLGTLFVLWHLLPPENFGLIALATLTMDYFSILSEMGFGAALIQRRDNIEKAANTAFTINILVNVVLTLIIFTIAPFTASFFSEPALTAVLRWLGLTFIIRSFGSIQNALLERDLDFRKRTIPDLGGSLIKAIISISLALTGLGVWALVIGQLAGITTTSTLLWRLSPWRPQFSWETSTAKKLLGFGLSIMGNNAMTIWEDNFDYLIIGRVFDTAALGIYQVAYRLPETLIINTLWLMTSVLFPTFSKFQDNKDLLKRGFLSTVRYVELLVAPACLGMFIAADPLIRVVAGNQWVDAIPILQVISLYTLILSIGFHAGDVYKAIGRPDILLKISLPLFPIRLFALWFGSKYGLVGVAVGHFAAEIISAVLNFIVIKKIINVTFNEIVLELKAFVGGAVLLLFALPVLYLSKDFLPLVRLIFITTAGATGYIGTIWLIDRNTLIKAIHLTGLPSRLGYKNSEE